jgi:hypothetical protein
MLTINSIVRRDTEVISTEADQDLIMVSIATGFYYGLSGVGRQIWESLEHPRRVADLVDDLAANYEIDSVACKEETLSFLDALLTEGLLRVEDAQVD